MPPVYVKAVSLRDPELMDVGTSAALSEPESARAAAIVDDTARYRFLAARSAVRRELASILGGSTDELEAVQRCAHCGADGHGRPAYRWRGVPIEAGVSYSRSGDWMALAVSDGSAVGIDLEDVGQAAFSGEGGIEAAALTESERLGLRGLKENLRPRARARLWTRKEAILKASGHGLRVDPSRMAVSDSSGPVRLLQWPAGVATPDPFQLRDLPSLQLGLPSAFAGAVAVMTDAPLRIAVG